MSDKKRGGGLSLVLGAIIGGIAGLLFAPKSGKETREDMKKVVKDSEAKIKETAEKAKVIFEKSKDKVDEIVDNVAKKIKKEDETNP
jgi:gas vesicle protein